MFFTLKCNNCGKTKSFNCSSLTWWVVDTDERQMGTESHHQANFETSCNDSWESADLEEDDIEEECGSITVTFDCWEYPDGFVNLKKSKASGAKLIEDNCQLDVSFQDDSSDDDEEY